MTLQELHNLGFVGRLDTGKAAGPDHGLGLFMGGQVVKLASGVGFVLNILILFEDANTTADGDSGSLVVTCGLEEEKFEGEAVQWIYEIKVKIHHMILTGDHDDTDSSSPAQLDGATDLLARGIQHTNTANEGQVSLRREV